MSVIYQDFSVAASLDVAENVFLGQELRRGIVVRRRAQRRETRRLIERLGAELDPDSGIDLIGGAGLQLIEIMKALVAEPSVLILDEPTAALTEDEARKLGDQCRRLRDSGLAILYVTHRLAEVFELADTVTVMRGGEVVFTKPVERDDPRRAGRHDRRTGDDRGRARGRASTHRRRRCCRSTAAVGRDRTGVVRRPRG